MSKQSALYDQPDSFGWISIILHWTTSVAIVVLWLVGMSISSQPAEAIDARRALHVTIGLIAWLPLAIRIFWRIRVKHPHVRGQSLRVHQFARLTHYLILGCLGVMLISGPIMAWALPERTGLASIALAFHSRAAILLLALVTLHVMGGLKHLMFNDDETIARIFVPRKEINQ